MKKLIIDNDIQTLQQKLKELSDIKKIFLYFAASKDESGISWCPDCNVAEPVVDNAVAQQNTDSEHFVFVTVYVGDKITWKDPNNVFRKEFQIKCIPTLLRWNSKNRLEENQLLGEDLNKILSED